MAAVEIYGVSRNFRDKFCYLYNQSANKFEEEIKEIKLIEESKYKVTSIITVWLLKYLVVNFADFGAFSGGHLACVAISLVKYVILT